MASSGLSPPAIFKKPAACTKAASPKPSTERRLRPAGKRAVRHAVRDQPLRRQLIQPRHVSQERRAGGIQIDADEIHARFDHRVERFTQVLNLDVVLVHADADVGRVDLHQFRQRILQTATDADRAAQRGIVGRKLLASDLAGRVDAGARFVHDRVGNVIGGQLAGDQLADPLFGLAAAGTVADGDGRQAMLAHRVDDLGFCLGAAFFAAHQVYDAVRRTGCRIRPVPPACSRS